MKKILITVAALIVVIGIGITYPWSNLDSIVKEAIQTYGSEATQTAVRVDSVKLRLAEGSAQINGLTVANPAGFTDPNIFSLGMIRTKIDTSSLDKNPIIIDEIIISAPSVVYEINPGGTANADVLKKNLGVGSGKSESKTSDEADALKMIIRKIVVEGSSAKVRIAALGQDQTVSLPRIVMTDVGKKSGGATAAEVATQLSDKMLGNLKGSVMKIGVDKYLGKAAEDIKAQMQRGIGGASGGSNEDIGNALKGLLGQ